MNDNQRLDWVDIAKGIGIILVVFAHTLVPQIRESSAAAKFLWIFIYNFHMPLFFFLSGLLFERGLARYTSRKKFILGKLKLLMLPYLVFSVLAYLIIGTAMHIAPLAGVLQGGGYSIAGIKEAAVQILTYNGHADQHLWFIYSLFIIFVVNILFPKAMKSKPMLVLLALLYISKARIHYFGILNYTVDNFIFFSLGRVLTAQKSLKPAHTIIAAAVLAAAGGVYSFFYTTGMPDNALLKSSLYLVRLISAVSGIMTVRGLSEYLQTKKISGLFRTLGLYSYDIYLMHAPFLVSGSMGILLAYTPLPVPVCCAAVLIAGLFLPLVVSKFIIRRIPALSLILLGRSCGKQAAGNNLYHNTH